jgi:hypothetical protein
VEWVQATGALARAGISGEALVRLNTVMKALLAEQQQQHGGEEEAVRQLATQLSKRPRLTLKKDLGG